MNLGFNGKSARALFARLPARHVTKHVLTSTSRTSFQTYSVFASFNSYISMTCSFSHFRHSYFCLIFINIRKISENSSVLVRDDRISAFGWMCTWDSPGRYVLKIHSIFIQNLNLKIFIQQQKCRIAQGYPRVPIEPKTPGLIGLTLSLEP